MKKRLVSIPVAVAFGLYIMIYLIDHSDRFMQGVLDGLK